MYNPPRPAPPIHHDSVPQAQALRPAISMYESATEHTKSLVLTASVQRSQRAAELNRKSCVGVDHRPVPYQTVGWSKRHASLPIGWTERIYALDPRVYLANSKTTKSPIGSHPCNSSTLSGMGIQVGTKKFPVQHVQPDIRTRIPVTRKLRV